MSEESLLLFVWWLCDCIYLECLTTSFLRILRVLVRFDYTPFLLILSLTEHSNSLTHLSLSSFERYFLHLQGLTLLKFNVSIYTHSFKIPIPNVYICKMDFIFFLTLLLLFLLGNSLLYPHPLPYLPCSLRFTINNFYSLPIYS